MKCTIPEISWHNRDPVLSLDVQPSKSGVLPYRLATGGTDSHVVIWYVTVNESGLASVDVAADLQRHQKAVNTVRFSPSGQYLASGDDEAVIIVWKPKTEHDISELSSNENEINKEQWVSMKFLRGHLEDVYDLSWSPDSSHLISGSIDNTAILWDVQKGRNLGILSGHGGFVQGVAWDPKNKYAATLSSDRTCRIHNVSTKKLSAKIYKATLPVPPSSEMDGKVVRLFHDDTLKSFFRRLTFSPDGQLLVVPSGIIEIPDSGKNINATYIFTRYDFSRPVVYLPSPREYTVAVRFCPLLFKLHEGASVFALPYRMVFAVATKNNVMLYDTQQPEPIAFISNIHYTRLTDLSWSSDGKILIASSTDGYCSIVTFTENELGEEYEQPVVHSIENGEPQNSEKKHVNKTSHVGSPEVTVKHFKKSKTPDCNVVEKGVISNGHDNENQSKHVMDTKSVSANSAINNESRIENDSEMKGSPRESKESLKRNSEGHETGSDIIISSSPLRSCDEPMQVDSCLIEDDADVRKENKKKSMRESEESDVEIIEEKTKLDTTVTANINRVATQLDNVHDKSQKLILKNSLKKNYEEAKSHIENSTSHVEPDEESMDLEIIEVKVESDNVVKQSLSHATNESDFLDNSKNVENCLEEKEITKVSYKADGSPGKNNVEGRSQDCEKSPRKKDAIEQHCETTPSKMFTNGNTPKTNSNVEGSVQPINVTPVANRTPRRVQFITLSSPKSKKKLL